MAAKSDQLETTLGTLFEKNTPKLPPDARKMVAEWAPWAALVAGLLALWSAYALWTWAHVVSGILDYTNSLCAAYATYGCAPVAAASRMGIWVWLSLAFLLVEGGLFLLAFPGLRAHKKAGWNYLYWGALVNIGYSVVSLLTGYGIFNFLGSLVGSAIGLWLLFQVRAQFTGSTK